MRFKFYSVLCLLITLFYLLRPLLPYFEYVINKEYIEKNLCVEKDNPHNSCHGKCYLEEQLKKQAERTSSDTNDKDKIIPDNKMDDHLQVSSTLSGLFSSDLVLNGYYSNSRTESYISKIFIPPRF
jgi:hypothetical protein